MHEVYESENNIHLVLELIQGGELFDRIKQNGTYDEIDAAKIMRALFQGLSQIHSIGIVHRDIKPENLLFKDKSVDSLKIVDFGLSASAKSGLLHMKCGSPGYVAPEILNDMGYDCKADIFSAGVILYILLTGKFVFSGRTYKEILSKNRDCEIPYPETYWEQRSEQVKDLISRLLTKLPQDRLTAAEALKHQWFSAMLSHDSQRQGEIIQQNDKASFKFSYEDVNVSSDDLDMQSEIHCTNLNHQIIAMNKAQNSEIDDSSPFWNIRRNNKDHQGNYPNHKDTNENKLKTFNTPLPKPRFPQNVIKSGVQGSNPSYNGSQEIALHGGIIMKNLNGGTLGGQILQSNIQSKLSKDCQVEEFNSNPFSVDISSLVKKGFTPLLKSSDRQRNHIQQMQQMPRALVPQRNLGLNSNPSTFQQLQRDTPKQNALKGVNQIREQRLSLEESKEIKIFVDETLLNRSNSPKMSSESSGSPKALQNQMEKKSTLQHQMMTFNNLLMPPQPENLIKRRISDEQKKYQMSLSNQRQSLQNAQRPLSSNNPSGGDKREDSPECSSGGSINDEDADEIADEDDNCKSAGYSSAMSLFALQKQGSSVNNMNHSQGLINLKGLSGGGLSEGVNTAMIDFRIHSNSGLMKQSITSIISQPSNLAEIQEQQKMFLKAKSQLPQQQFMSQLQGQSGVQFDSRIRKNVTSSQPALRKSNEITLDDHRGQNDGDQANLANRLYMVPTTPGSVFGGSRNLMKKSQQMILETHGEEDDHHSQYSLYEIKKSNKSGDGNNGSSQEGRNLRSSFGPDQFSNQSSSFFNKSEMNVKKLKLYDEIRHSAAVPIQSSNDPSLPGASQDQIMTKKIVPFRSTKEREQVLSDDSSYDLRIVGPSGKSSINQYENQDPSQQNNNSFKQRVGNSVSTNSGNNYGNGGQSSTNEQVRNKIPSLFGNRTQSKAYLNKNTASSTGRNTINRLRTGEDGEEIVMMADIENQVEAIEEDFEEDKDYADSEVSHRRLNKIKLMSMQKSSEGSASNGTGGPEGQKPKEPEGVPSEQDDGLRSHSFHTANQSFQEESSGGGFQSLKRHQNRDSSDNVGIGSDLLNAGSRSASNHLMRMQYHQGVSGVHSLNQVYARDVDINHINEDFEYRKNVMTYEARVASNALSGGGAGLGLGADSSGGKDSQQQLEMEQFDDADPQIKTTKINKLRQALINQV